MYIIIDLSTKRVVISVQYDKWKNVIFITQLSMSEGNVFESASVTSDRSNTRLKIMYLWCILLCIYVTRIIRI